MLVRKYSMMQTTESVHFPPTPIALKMAVAVGIGMLVGLEREWSNKDVGIRAEFFSYPSWSAVNELLPP
jgi:hypothetical protein